MADSEQTKGVGRDWIAEMIKRGALITIEGKTPLPQEGVTFICDSETDPTKIVTLGLEDSPIRLIAVESGVLILSQDTQMRRKLGIDPSTPGARRRLATDPIPLVIQTIVIGPLLRAWNEGTHNVFLCVNPSSIGGALLPMNSVEIVDHMVRGGVWLAQMIQGLNIGYIVHMPSSVGDHANYFVDLSKWNGFYDWYETTHLGRQNDADPTVPAGAHGSNLLQADFAR